MRVVKRPPLKIQFSTIRNRRTARMCNGCVKSNLLKSETAKSSDSKCSMINRLHKQPKITGRCCRWEPHRASISQSTSANKSMRWSRSILRCPRTRLVRSPTLESPSFHPNSQSKTHRQKSLPSSRGPAQARSSSNVKSHTQPRRIRQYPCSGKSLIQTVS